MIQMTIVFGDHHEGSAISLSRIIRNDWPAISIQIMDENGRAETLDVEHAKLCTDCQGLILNRMLNTKRHVAKHSE